MKRLAALAVTVGLATASCSGARSIGSMLPPVAANLGGSHASSAGARTTRELAVAAPPAGWATTATQVFSLKNAADLGALDPARSLTVRLGLQLHNVDQLKRAVQAGTKLSPDAFRSAYGPTAGEVAQVTGYLQGQGLTNVTVEPNNLLISATGSAAQVAKAFDTSLHAFSLAGSAVYANTTPAYVPAALNGIVVAVLGLNNVKTFAATPRKGVAVPAPPVPLPGNTAMMAESPCSISNVDVVGLPSPQPMPTPQAYTTGCLRNYLPSDYWRAYDGMNTGAAPTVSVAIMAAGSLGTALGDFRVNRAGDWLQPTRVAVRQVGLASPDASGADEWTLDMTASAGMAKNVQSLVVYLTTSLTDSDVALEYNHWVTDNSTQIANSSFGECEYAPAIDGAMLVDDMIFLQGAAQGQTMFASSGDSGSFCSVGAPNGIPAGAPLVEYPASSPYVVAVGGTTLASQVDGSYQGESAWSAGGGGVSQFEIAPTWEQSVQPAGAAAGGVSFRGVPDMAMDGDLTTGMVLYTSSTGWTTTGGTSLSSPLAAGVWAEMLQNHPGLGFAAPQLYRVWSSSTPGTKLLGPAPTIDQGPYHDVITGGNGLFTAAPGFDYTTGLGTLDVDKLNAML